MEENYNQYNGHKAQYKSKYGKTIITIDKRINNQQIISTNGVSYYLYEINVLPLEKTMNVDVDLSNDISSNKLLKTESWSCTVELRFKLQYYTDTENPNIGGSPSVAKKLRILQQKWISSEGNEKWENVPIVED